MLIIDYTGITINVNGQYIKEVTKSEDKSLYILTIELPITPHKCPYCHTMTSYVKDYRYRKINFGLHQGVKLFGKYRQRRYHCPYCHRNFSEKNSFVDRYRQISKSNMRNMLNYFDEALTYETIANLHNVSAPTVIRLMDTFTIPKPKSLPRVLGIDEFKGNAAGQKYQVILTDSEAKSIVDILPKRDTVSMIKYFLSYPLHVRKEVRFVTMDMSHQFKCVVEQCFPNANIICDRFHITRLLQWAMERVRKDEQKVLYAASRMLKQNKRVLTKRIDRLTEADKIKLTEIFRVSIPLRKAYQLCYTFREVYRLKDPIQIETFIVDWLGKVKASKLKEFQSFHKTFTQWKPYIINAFVFPYSNGFTEGCNNKIKVLKRVSYGLVNFERLRTRILSLKMKRKAASQTAF